MLYSINSQFTYTLYFFSKSITPFLIHIYIYIYYITLYVTMAFNWQVTGDNVCSLALMDFNSDNLSEVYSTLISSLN